MCPLKSSGSFRLMAMVCLSPQLPGALWPPQPGSPFSHIHLEKRLLQASTGTETELQTSLALC